MKLFKVVTLLLLLIGVSLPQGYAVSTGTCTDTDTKVLMHFNGTDASVDVPNSSTSNDEVLVINNTDVSNVLGFSFANAPNAQLGQSWTATHSQAVSKVSLGLSRTGTRSTTVFAELYAASGGVPTGSVLATSDTITFNSISTSATLTDFSFSSRYTVTKGSTYATVIRLGSETYDASNYLSAHGVFAASNYAGGQWFRFEGSYNATYTTFDAGFRVYTVPTPFFAFDNAQVDTAQSQFGGASVLLDGAGDQVYANPTTLFDIGTSDFTMDTWVRFNSLAAQATIYSNQESATNWYGLNWLTSNNLHFEAESAGTTTMSMDFAWTPSTNTWYHVAFTRSGSSFRAFVNGTQVGSTATDSDSLPTLGSGGFFTWGFGREASGGANAVQLNGWMDESRWVSGIAIWTANFTSPTAEYSTCVTRRRVLATTIS